ENINPKDSRRNTQLADRGQPKSLETDFSGADTKYQVDQTTSTRFKVLNPDHNKGKTSLKVDLDTNTLIFTIVADIQALQRDSEDELKDDSDEYLRLEKGWIKTSNSMIMKEFSLLIPLKDNPLKERNNLLRILLLNLLKNHH
nr:hypothetical protein [Tanacetum cinerariifolium]